MGQDLFRTRLEAMIDLRHPLAVLGTRIDWAQLEQRLGPLFAHRDRAGRQREDVDLFGPTTAVWAGGVSPAGRPRLPFRLMASRLYLKHAYGQSDESVCERWAENVVWQFFSGMTFYEPRLPCDATQIGRFRKILGEAGMEELLRTTLVTAHQMQAVTPADLEQVVVDTTVQEKAIAYPTDSRLLEVTRRKVVQVAQRAGIALKQTYAREGRRLQRRAGGYAHARQFRRLRKVLKRQRTILGRLLREIARKRVGLAQATRSALDALLERAERIRTQKPKDRHKRYALHAPEVECIGKGKARQPYEFGVKVSLAIAIDRGLIVGTRSLPGNPYDGHTLAEQMEQTSILLEDVQATPHTVYADLGYRGAQIEQTLIHRGRYASLSEEQRKALKRRQVIEPVIGHLKQDHGMRRCWLKGAEGDALHALSCAAGYNIQWLLRAIARMKLGPVFLRLLRVLLGAPHPRVVVPRGLAGVC